MRRDLRTAIRARDRYQCAYCGVSETDAGSELTIDHYRPRVHGGEDTFENCLYCCYACNGFKGDYWRDEASIRLLNPYLDDVTQHIRSDAGGRLLGLTARGDFHIAYLHLNRPELLAHRRERLFEQRMDEVHNALMDRLAQIEKMLDDLRMKAGARAVREIEDENSSSS